MAWVQADLDIIEAAIVSGQRRVRLDGREVEYHSVEQMLIARDAIRNAVNRDVATAAGVTRPRSYRTRTTKGL